MSSGLSAATCTNRAHAEHMQINLRAQAVLTEKIERSKEFGELTNEPSVSPGGSQEDFDFCTFGLVSRFRLLLRIDRKMQIEGRTQTGYHSLITVTASSQLLSSSVYVISLYITHAMEIPQNFKSR